MFTVTRQRENCGKMQTIFVNTPEEAGRAFDIAVNEGDIFVNIWDENLDAEVRRHLDPVKWV